MSPTRSAGLLVLGASAIVASCGGSTAWSGDDDASRSGGDATDEGADSAIQGGGADSGANDRAAHLSGDGGGDDGRPGGDADAFDAKEDRQSSSRSDPSPPATLPSTGTVTFVVTNRSAFQRYIVTRGQFCDPFTVDGQRRLPWARVPARLWRKRPAHRDRRPDGGNCVRGAGPRGNGGRRVHAVERRLRLRVR